MVAVAFREREPTVTIHQIPNTLKLDSFWMPFTANRQFKAAPRLIASAEGMHYTTVDGRKVLDGSAGMWCVNAGHGRRQIAAAVERQLMNLDFAPSFNMGHPLAFDFAERLAETIRGATLERIDDSYTFVSEDQPELLTELIVEFTRLHATP